MRAITRQMELLCSTLHYRSKNSKFQASAPDVQGENLHPPPAAGGSRSFVAAATAVKRSDEADFSAAK